MMGRFQTILFLSLTANVLFSAPATATGFHPADSLRIKTANGKQFILHKVDPAETWIKLARRYNCTVEELQAANPGVEMLKIDQIVHIPLKTNQTANTTTSPAEIKKETTPSASGKGTPVFHTVKPGETLFGISTKYNQPVEKIIEFNKIAGDKINAGQKLIVRYDAPAEQKVLAQTEPQRVVVPPASPQGETVMASANKAATPAPAPAPRETTSTSPAAENAIISPAENNFEAPTRTIIPLKKGNSGKTTVQVVETGVGTCIQDEQFSGDKFYGLHRSAPIGTIIKVTNRMNNKFVYVKVVGSLPDTGENSNVIIKMSQAVAEKLNVLDPLFQVELSYGMIQ